MENGEALVSQNNDLRILLPALVGREGERAKWRFLEFFTVHIRNANTRAAYSHAAGLFLGWCEERGITEL